MSWPNFLLPIKIFTARIEITTKKGISNKRLSIIWKLPFSSDNFIILIKEIILFSIKRVWMLINVLKHATQVQTNKCALTYKCDTVNK